MRNESDETKTIGTWLFDPFKYVAGMESLLIGLFAIAIAGSVGSFSSTHFDGVLDTHTGMQGPWWCFLAEGLISWLSLSVVLWVLGKIVSKTAFRTIDLFGTQALARWPTLIVSAACLSTGYTQFSKFITWKFANTGEETPFLISDAVAFGSVVVLMIFVTCWMTYLMYKSYSVSCNVKGGRAIGSFVVGIILGEVISKIAIVSMLVWVQQDQSWRPHVEGSPDSALISYQHEKVYTFEHNEGLEKISGDEGMTVGVENDEFRIHGTTTDSEWGPEAVKVAVVDDGGVVDVSGTFRIETRDAAGLVFLEAETQKGGPLIYMYQWSPMFDVFPILEAYQIQTRWYSMPARLLRGVSSKRVPGNPSKEFCTMRIHVREDHKTVDFFANGQYQDTVAFEESFGRVIAAKMELQTPHKGKRFDVRFDDLTVKWNDSPLSAARAAMREKTGDLLLHYTFDEEGEHIEDVSGQECHGEIRKDPHWVVGAKGQALALVGESDAISVTSSGHLRTVQNSDFTVMAWFNPMSQPDNNNGNGFGIVIKPGSDVGLIRDNEGIFRFTRYFHAEGKDGEEKADADDTKAVWLGKGRSDLYTWYHLAGVALDGGRTSQLYINGVLVAEEEHPDFVRPLESGSPWYIGACDGPPNRWPAHGLIDDVRLYGRALSVEEIKSIYGEAEINDAETLETCVRVLAHQLDRGHKGGQYRASLLLADIGPAAKSAVPELIEAAKDIRICAGPVLALGTIGVVNDEVIAVITDALDHESQWDRSQAAIALGRLNVTSAVPKLEALWNDKDPDVRMHVHNAVLSLGAIRLEKVQSPLLRAGNDPWPFREKLDESVIVHDIDVRDGISIHDMRDDKNYKTFKGENRVVRMHPTDKTTPGIANFSKATQAGKGTIIFHFKGMQDHDCILRIRVDSEIKLQAIVDGRNWQVAEVPFDHADVLLEVHPGGPESYWDCENLFFTYKIVAEAVAE
ncbi:MAG: hypothetical protein HN919_14870 [Verrucomicrobia bacterium]|jgi:hypothetical protein|nr:hypothetical protein [Verrucomicrobiota bacterium]